MKNGLVFIGALLLVSGLVFSETAKAGKAKMEVFKGYLSDASCATTTNGVAADGTDMVMSPEKHTVACLTAAGCAASGYGLMIKGADGKYAFTKFDPKGSDQAKALLDKTKEKTALKLDVKGTMENGMIMVASIKEEMGHKAWKAKK